MKMKDVVLALLVLITSSCSKPLYNSIWQSTPIIPDGKANEWKVPLSYYDNNGKIEYTFSNDKYNMYACMKVANEKAQMKIINAGLELWIDTTGKSKHHIGIAYPLPSSISIDLSLMDGEEKANSITTSLKRKYFNNSKELLLTGFKSPIGGLTHNENENGITVNMDWDNTNTLVYEAVIPFKTFYKESLQVSDSTKVFGITIVVNGIEGPKNAEQTNGTGGGALPGGGAMGSGGMPGGRNMGGGVANSNSKPTNPLFETNKIKTHLLLSTREKKVKSLPDGVW